jgi:hypothetical protein
MTRQAVAKHLSILEKANLVSWKRQGRDKLHFFNPVPINEIAERWISKFERPRLTALSELKKNLERRGDARTDCMGPKPEQGPRGVPSPAAGGLGGAPTLP